MQAPKAQVYNWKGPFPGQRQNASEQQLVSPTKPSAGSFMQDARIWVKQSEGTPKMVLNSLMGRVSTKGQHYESHVSRCFMELPGWSIFPTEGPVGAAGQASIVTY